MTRAEVVAVARAWLGTPYVHQAARRGAGCDCIGLLKGVGHDLGMPEAERLDADARYKGYSRRPSARLFAGANEYLDPITVGNLEPGDIVLMSTSGVANHFGLISSVDPPYIIHAWSSAGRVVENRLDEKWRARVMRAYRYRGIE